MPGAGVRAILAQADFVAMSVLGRPLLLLVILVSGLYSVLLPVSGFRQSDIEGVTILLSLIYGVMAALLLTGIAEELETGRALIYLAQPITRREYVAAWLLAGPLLLGVGYVVSILVPALVLQPRLVTLPAVYKGVFYGLGEMLYVSLVSMLASLLLRNRSRSVLAAISFMFIAPVVVLISVAIVSETLGVYIDDNTMDVILSLFHPVAASEAPSSSNQAFGLVYAYSASIILAALILRQADGMEV